MSNQEDNFYRAIGRLEGKLDLIIKKVDDLDKSFRVLEEGRLSSLERQFANLGGKLSIISAVVAIVISLAITIIPKL